MLSAVPHKACTELLVAQSIGATLLIGGAVGALVAFADLVSTVDIVLAVSCDAFACECYADAAGIAVGGFCTFDALVVLAGEAVALLVGAAGSGDAFAVDAKLSLSTFGVGSAATAGVFIADLAGGTVRCLQAVFASVIARIALLAALTVCTLATADATDLRLLVANLPGVALTVLAARSALVVETNLASRAVFFRAAVSRFASLVEAKFSLTTVLVLGAIAALTLATNLTGRAIRALYAATSILLGDTSLGAFAVAVAAASTTADFVVADLPRSALAVFLAVHTLVPSADLSSRAVCECATIGCLTGSDEAKLVFLAL